MHKKKQKPFGQSLRSSLYAYINSEPRTEMKARAQVSLAFCNSAGVIDFVGYDNAAKFTGAITRNGMGESIPPNKFIALWDGEGYFLCYESDPEYAEEVAAVRMA